MRRRLLAVLAVVTMGGAALVSLPAAQAADVDWSVCGGGITTNCVESAYANGVPTLPGQDTTDGNTVRDYPYAKGTSYDAHAVIFGVWHDANGDGSSLTQDADPSVLYTMTVRTTIRPREMSGHVKDATFSVHHDPVTGWEFTLQFRPTPVHFVGYAPGDSRICTITACGDDTWQATSDFAGTASGYVTDNTNTGLTTTERDERDGMFSAYNAQGEDVYYDPGTNSLVVLLANAHLTGTGALATGTFNTFLPTAFLEGTMNVPDPSTLSSGTVTVVRSAGGAVSSAPFTLTHVSGGIEINITGITYSRPTYTIHPGPGKPRYVHARKISTHKARVSFTKPASNGGHRINWYQARCHRLGRTWHGAKAFASPITVGNLPKGRVYCQVRAHNKLGYGAWSVTKHT
jgi:hypothetical protein